MKHIKFQKALEKKAWGPLLQPAASVRFVGNN